MRKNDSTGLPEPIGSFEVGLSNADFEYVSSFGERRKISVTLYYPAEHDDSAPRALYAFPEILPASRVLCGDLFTPEILETTTACITGAKVSTREQVYPLLIYNHGYLCYEMHNTSLCANLASSGYIVASLGHPGESAAIRYTDGSIVLPYPEVIDRYTSGEAMNQKMVAAYNRFAEIPEEDDAALVEAGRNYYNLATEINRQVGVWVSDTIKAVDHLERMNRGEIPNVLKEKIRLQIGYGITGHSMGGTTAIQTCRDDPRCVGGINMDGGSFGDYYNQDVGKPILTISQPDLWKLVRAIYLSNSADTFHLVIEDARHMDFTDLPFIASGFSQRGLANRRDPDDLLNILTSYHLNFFAHYLLQHSDPFKGLNDPKTLFFENRSTR